jgi:branched-chain amino acid transport system permease protein
MSQTTKLIERGRELRPSTVQVAPKIVLPFAIGLALAGLLQATAPYLGEFAAKIVLDSGIAIILAVSLNIVNGFTGQFSMGHAGFMALWGYTAGAITYYGSFKLWGTAAVHPGAGTALFVGSCVAGGLVAAGAGYVVGLPSLRLRGDYLAIVTLGFGEIFRVLIQRTDDVARTAKEVSEKGTLELVTSVGGSLGFNGLPFYTSIFWVYSFAAVTLLTAYRLKTSSWGRAFLSVRENEVAAEAMGIHTTKVKVRAFVVSAFFAGVAGGLFAHELGVTLNAKELGFQKSFDIIIMVVLGGMGSVSGAVVAAIILTILPEPLRAFDQYRMIIYALALILMMILRPQGLFGIREVWELGFLKKLIGEKR